jgi:hypothetical protein
MLKRVGYLEKGREPAADPNGKRCDILELTINGMRFGIRMADLRGALAGRIFARVERLERNWGLRITCIVGLARLSASGKALNIELNQGGSFTVSLDTIRAVVARRERYAGIAAITDLRTVPVAAGMAGASGQQRLPAGVA